MRAGRRPGWRRPKKLRFCEVWMPNCVLTCALAPGCPTLKAVARGESIENKPENAERSAKGRGYARAAKRIA